MNVNPRKNKRDISCVNCGACVEACNKELGQGKGLFQLRFGAPTPWPRRIVPRPLMHKNRIAATLTTIHLS